MPGGASWFDTWSSVDAGHLAHGSGDAAIAEVTPGQLDEALAALARGDVEHLGLHEGESFLQVAGEGPGPYAIEYHPGPQGTPVGVPAGVTDEAVRYALHAFLAGDPGWARPFPWEPIGTPPEQASGRRRGRLFGRG